LTVSSRSGLAELYKRESNTKVKERLLLILRVEGDEQLPAHVVKAIHRSKPWASYWLERYNKEGIEGLRDKPKKEWKNTSYSSRGFCKDKKKINRKQQQTRMDYPASK
jgi:leucine-zipper of insertion element IS481